MKMFRSQGKGGDSGAGGNPEIAESLTRAAARIEDVGAAADRAVDEIQADLDRRTRAAIGTRIDREQLAVELMASIAQRASVLRDEAGELSRLLERASAQIARIGAEVKPESAQVAPPVNSPARPRTPAQPVSEGLRLLATQMAVAGSTRAEVEDRLRREFGVDDPSSALDEVLGPGN